MKTIIISKTIGASGVRISSRSTFKSQKNLELKSQRIFRKYDFLEESGPVGN